MMGRPHRCNHAAPTASGRFFHWQPAAVNGAQSSDSGCSAIACWISRILGADVSSPQLDASSWAQLCSIMPQFLSKLYQGNHLPAQDTVSYKLQRGTKAGWVVLSIVHVHWIRQLFSLDRDCERYSALGRTPSSKQPVSVQSPRISQAATFTVV